MRLFRFTSLGTSLHGYERLPSGVSTENVALTAADGGESFGVLLRRGGERGVVHFMHPRGDQTRHYLMPALLDAGFAVFGQAGRYLFNDGDFRYERVLFDVAAANAFLRERGYERVIGLGNSGGGTLFAFYQAQACTPKAQRLVDTPSGEPVDLPGCTMPALDAIVHVATHLGQGKLMRDNIDPSVVDENDPHACDATLDMFDARNGFAPPPAASRYAADFLARYRKAQDARMRRIDGAARQQLASARLAARMLDDASLSLRARRALERRAVASRYLQVHRTQANPALLDPSITPNRRALGSFYSERPDVANYTLAGFGKWQTPGAWLSTWSYAHSRGNTLACLPRNTQPTLVVAFTADNMIFPGELEMLHEQSPARDKALAYVDADHFGHAPSDARSPAGRAGAAQVVCDWLSPRFL